MEAKISTWKQQRTRLGAKHSRVNRELAFHFAGWATDYARRASATTIAIEDLSTLEAGGYHRARCRPCGLDGNRDQVAAVNTAKGAITGQDSLTADRKTWRKGVKKAPTPRRTRHKRVRNSVAPVPGSDRDP